MDLEGGFRQMIGNSLCPEGFVVFFSPIVSNDEFNYVLNVGSALNKSLGESFRFYHFQEDLRDLYFQDSFVNFFQKRESVKIVDNLIDMGGWDVFKPQGPYFINSDKDYEDISDIMRSNAEEYAKNYFSLIKGIDLDQNVPDWFKDVDEGLGDKL